MVSPGRPSYGRSFFCSIILTTSLLTDVALTQESSTNISVAAISVPSGNGSIDFISAVQHEVSVSLEQERLSTFPAIPVPTNITEHPGYKAVDQIASVMPLKQQGIRYYEPSAMVANLVASTNSTTESYLHQRQSGMRILIVGDSITQGREGDCTWRYRIWQWLRNTGTGFRLVGPYIGTKAPPPPTAPPPPALYGSPADESFSTDGGYCEEADSAFLAESNHFAVWGRAAAVDKGLIAGVLQSTPADFMFLFLGFNDLGWFYSDVSGTLASIQTLITNARAVNPNMKFAIANIPHRTHINGRDDLVTGTDEYNRRLPALLASMSTSQSPAHVVDVAGTYQCLDSGCSAGYDGLHPNGCGEFQLARAFSKTLVDDFGIGSSPLEGSCQSGRGLQTPSNIRAFSSPQGVTVTWDKVYGAYGYDVEASANGVSATFSPGSVMTNRWDSQWPGEGWEYTVRVRAVYGDETSAWTSSVSATATPELPPPPRNIQIEPSGSGMTITWDPPTGGATGSVVLYNVIYWDWEWDHCQYIGGAAFKSSPAVIDELTPGRNYVVWLVTWNENGQGLPSDGSAVIPGGGSPSVPSGLRVNSYDPTTVGLSWSNTNSAAGYRVWSRNINKAGSTLELIGNVTMNSGHCNDQYFLFPGVWNYAFAISAFNGHLDSGKSPEVIAPSPAKGDSTNPTCGPEPAWCPGGGSISIPPVGGGTTTSEGGGTTPTTTVIGGTTTVIGGTTTVIGGTTTTVGTQPTVTGFPIVTNGHCTGRDCVGGKCDGPLCASFGCSGNDCSPSGVCTGPECTPRGCIGPNCVDGACQGGGLGCLDHGCIGPGCEGGSDGDGGSGHCTGIDCISLGCSGPDCVGGICIGPNCTTRSCSGPSCYSGSCATTASCEPFGGGKGGGSDAPDDNPDESCSTSKAYPTCTTKFVVVTTDFPDLTSKTTTTETISTCYTITACSGSATTVSTTTESATTVQDFCQPKNCGTACGARRRAIEAVPTDVPATSKPTLANVPPQGNRSMALPIDLIERDIPSPGSGDWGAWYDNLLRSDNSVLVDNDDGVLGTNTAVVQVIWGDEARNIVVQELHGCFALFCISQIGAFVAHFWEKPSVVNLDGRFEPDIINILRRYLGSEDNVYQLGPSPNCYIMGGTNRAIAENGADEKDTLTQSDSAGMKYRSQYNRIRDTILDILPRASVDGFAYTRQVNPDFQTLGYGKGAVLYDPVQKERPADVPEENWSSRFGTVAVYLQGYKATQVFLSRQEIQIWRLHLDPTSWTNAAFQANRNTPIDPCDTDRDNGLVRSQDDVERGSENTDVTTTPFDIILGDGHYQQFSCTYRGGPYAPTAQSGAVAGELSCAVGVRFTCVRPNENRATTCGKKPVSECGKLGVNCNDVPYYQLLATCKV